jgi:hypothetical protein
MDVSAAADPKKIERSSAARTMHSSSITLAGPVQSGRLVAIQPDANMLHPDEHLSGTPRFPD